MDSLALYPPSRIKHCKRYLLNFSSKSESTATKGVRFVCFQRQRCKTRSFCMRKSQYFSEDKEDGVSSSSSPSPSPSWDEQINGQRQIHHQSDEFDVDDREQQHQQDHHNSSQLGSDRESSGSMVTFRVYSQPQTGESELRNFRINGKPNKQKEKELEEEELEKEERQPNEEDHPEHESSIGTTNYLTYEDTVRDRSGVQDKTEDVEKEKEEEYDIEGGGGKPKKVTHNIIFISAEVAPYSKTGGLGDVCGSLPIALAARGHRVMVVSPRYIHGTPQDQRYAAAFDADCRVKVYCFGGEHEVAFFHEYRDGVDWVFVDHPAYHRPGNPYGDNFGAFGDNQFRFTLLCHAACEVPLVLPLGGFTYGEKCLFLVNDWHAGLVSVLLAAKYRPYGVYKDARSVLVIHNLSHQGVEPAVTYGNLGLPPQWYGALEWVFPEWARAHALDKGEAVNILKGAIVTSDRILTVSKGYSWEITTVEGGYGLHELLTSRQFVLNGIINGIDTCEWDPSSDKHIAAHYSIDDLSGKVECKAALQKELGLPIRPECPLIGFIGRLDYQKGIDLIQAVVPELMQDDVQFAMLGSGNPQYEAWMKATENTYKDKFRAWVGFNVPISHRITAGCDILLMPSRFEPCGLNQLYAMRYGTIPVVHATGGLRDTVETYNPYATGPDGLGSGTGWAFSPLTKESMLSALRNALMTHREYKTSWEGLMKRGMKRDFTWDSAAAQYEKVFEWAFVDPPYC